MTRDAMSRGGGGGDEIERRAERQTLVYRIGRIMCRMWVDRAFDLKVYNANYVPRRGGVLIVSNHQSYLDPVLLAVKLHRPLSYMAKSELFENPFLAWLIRNLNAYPVRQGEGDVGAVKETIRRLQEGHALNLYPEGTRSPDGTLQPLLPGVGLIVRRAGVPVVPASGAGDVRSADGLEGPQGGRDRAEDRGDAAADVRRAAGADFKGMKRPRSRENAKRSAKRERDNVRSRLPSRFSAFAVSYGAVDGR